MRPVYGNFIAHRGLHGEGIPENSLAAFSKAVQAGFPIELDIRLTRDGRLVVFHDATLDRMCGVRGRISSMTWAELRKLRLKGTDQGIPLFSQVLRTVNGRVPLLIELKNGSPYGTMQRRLKNLLKDYCGEYGIESFDPFTVMWYRLNAPDIYRGQLISTHKGGKPLEYLARLVCARPFIWKLLSRPDFIASDLRTTGKKTAAQAGKAGAGLILWTIRSPEQLEQANKYSDTVIFEGFIP